MSADFTDRPDHEILVELPELLAHLNSNRVRVTNEQRHQHRKHLIHENVATLGMDLSERDQEQLRALLNRSFKNSTNDLNLVSL